METFDRPKYAPLISRLARTGLYVGTSSWRYEGWLGQLYTPSRYEYRGKIANSRFKKDCLTEYGETFRTVCVDAAYYTFPTEKYLQALSAQTPDDFLFGFKVTDAVTVKQFPNLPRFGDLAGTANRNFLNAELFADRFLGPCESIRPKVGLLMFEFSKFHKRDYEHGRDFVRDLDTFLGKLPKGWPYGVEMRNKTFLHWEYFAMLRKHGVAHVFNSWTDMSLNEQLAHLDSITSDKLFAARLLLKPGRTYEQAVKEFSPYTETKELFDEGTAQIAQLIRKAEHQLQKGRSFVYVNNRFEGNALQTVVRILKRAGFVHF